MTPQFATGSAMMTLYDFLYSGNGYKVRLLLALLGTPFRLIECDIMQGETRTPEFLAINPNGKIPALVLQDGTALAESGAMLFYLADSSDFLPDDRLARAQVLQWMFFEQYSHEPYIAVARFWKKHREATPEIKAQLPAKMASGYSALDVMEKQLMQSAWLAIGRPTIADLALYAYTHVAEEGGFDLSGYPAIGRWIAQIGDLPGYQPITWRPPQPRLQLS